MGQIKILSPHEESNSEGLRFDSSWGLRIFICPTLVTRRKTSFLIPYRAQKLTISTNSINTREFVRQSKASLVGDRFLYLHDLII